MNKLPRNKTVYMLKPNDVAIATRWLEQLGLGGPLAVHRSEIAKPRRKTPRARHRIKGINPGLWVGRPNRHGVLPSESDSFHPNALMMPRRKTTKRVREFEQRKNNLPSRKAIGNLFTRGKTKQMVRNFERRKLQSQKPKNQQHNTRSTSRVSALRQMYV